MSYPNDLLTAILTVSILLAVLFGSDKYQDHVKIQNLTQHVEQLEKSKRTLITRYESKVDSLDRRSIDNVVLGWALITESSRPSEYPFLAWSIRNRVDMGFRGDSTYQEVILRYRQYSFFNHPHQVRDLIEIGPHTQSDRFQKALTIAQEVRHAPEEASLTEATHFFSERSMKYSSVPYWWNAAKEVESPIADNRFRFMKN